MLFNIDFQTLLKGPLGNGLRILLVVLITIILLKLTKLVAKRLIRSIKKQRTDSEYIRRVDTMGNVIRFIIRITIIVIACAMILTELGIKIGPILAAAGIVGVAVGLGAQSLIRDIISGFFIFLEDQIRVGDVIEAAGKSGVVERMTLRMTTLRDIAGNVHFIPNGQINTVTNMTKGYSRFVFDIGVAYRENVDEVMEVMKAVDEAMREDPEFASDILEPLEVLGVDAFTDSAVKIKARTTTRPIKQWRIAREFNRRLKIAFDEKNIEIPFPHITLYMGEDKEGAAPPARIVISDNKTNKK
jgi:small conductance mechanosensitive channel